MPKQVKQKIRPTDLNELAHRQVELSVGEPEVKLEPPQNLSQYMAAIGRKGGQIGGKRRLKTMTKAERRRVATKAAKARWKRQKS